MGPRICHIGALKCISPAADESRRDIHSAALTRRRSYWTGLTAGTSDERLRTVSVMSVSKLDCSLGIDRILARVLTPSRCGEKQRSHRESGLFPTLEHLCSESIDE
jgi:hypothetical protein